MFDDKSILVTITLIGFLILLASYFVTIILLIIFNRKVFALDKTLYSYLKLEKFFFLWGEKYKQFVFGKGYCLCEHSVIRILAKMLDYLTIIGTAGFLVGVLFAVIDVVIGRFL